MTEAAFPAAETEFWRNCMGKSTHDPLDFGKTPKK